jgi:hypothetical protein
LFIISAEKPRRPKEGEIMDAILIYFGSVVIIGWGIAHIVPTSSIIRGFGPLTTDNRLIIKMEWVAEGLTFIFIGTLVVALTLAEGPDSGGSKIAYKASAIMLLVLAQWSSMTGARTSIAPMKICPYVKCFVALLFVIGSVL